MAQVPVLSSRKVIKVFESLGWQQVRQRGSHVVMVRDDHPATLSVPAHKEVARGTLRGLIRAAGLTVDEFVTAVKNVR